MKFKKITKAILPVAGFGTRFLPATKVQPKEMLAIFDTPAIQFIVEEAVAAGITDIFIITGRGKRAIEDHFDINFELEKLLQKKGKNSELVKIQRISSSANFYYVRQSIPLGNGDAISKASSLIPKGEPVAVLFGDDLVFSSKKKNGLRQLMDIYQSTGAPAILLCPVSPDKIHKYGIVNFSRKNKNVGLITDIIEKPNSKQAPSNLSIVGKFIINSEILAKLQNLESKKKLGEELELTSALQEYIQDGNQIYGKILEGKRFDVGDKEDFLRANLFIAKKKLGKRKVKKIIQNFI